MLVVDAQIHIWKGHKPTNREPPSGRRLHGGRRAEGDGRRRRQCGRHPSAGMGSQFQRAGGRGRAPAPQPPRHPRQLPARQAGKPCADRRLEEPAGHARTPLRVAAAASADVADRWNPRLAVARGRARRTARRVARTRSPAGHRPDRGTPSRPQADHRSLRAPRRRLVEPAGPRRGGEAHERGAEGDRRAELLERALSLSRHPRTHPEALRRVRSRADVLGNRHHAHAVLVEAVRDDVHRRAALAVGEGQGAHHGTRALQLARLEPARQIEPTSEAGRSRCRNRDSARRRPHQALPAAFSRRPLLRSRRPGGRGRRSSSRASGAACPSSDPSRRRRRRRAPHAPRTPR